MLSSFVFGQLVHSIWEEKKVRKMFFKKLKKKFQAILQVV